MNNNNKAKINLSTWITASVLGAVVALSGIQHGIFEILQGNKAVDTFIIQSIGTDHQRWMNGEEAFTVIPNFLITGIVAIFVSCIIIFWSFRFLHKSYGPAIFILLYIISTLVGGGIVHVLFYLPVWLFSGRIRNEIYWRRNNTDSKTIQFLSSNWKTLLGITSLFIISSQVISAFGITGVSDELIMAMVWSSILLALITMTFTIFAALSRDIQSNTSKS